LILRSFVPCSRACARDRSSGADEDLDRGWGDGHAARLPRTQRPGADFHRIDHPIVRSFEPGENWGWCYVDEIELGFA
jgi:hypothetical protein